MVIGLMLFKMSVQTGILVNWKINQAKIEKLYCENKDNPLMHCEGKCYLSKQLKQIENDFQKSKTPPYEKLVKSSEIILFCEDLAFFQLANLILKENQPFGGYYTQHITENHHKSCFHPPDVFSFLA